MHMLQSHNQEAQQKIQVAVKRTVILKHCTVFMLGESKTEGPCYWKICRGGLCTAEFVGNRYWQWRQ